MLDEKIVIGIITSRASESEQRDMLGGILAQAEKLNIYPVVISNIFNFSEYFADVDVENKIYELMESERLDGLIYMEELVLESKLRNSLLNRIRKLNIPVVVTGESGGEFPSVNSDVRRDFRNIARHLTEVHGFTEIDVLTGYKEAETAHLRAEGIRDVMREKGLPFSDDNVIFGEFWTTDGEKLAEEYLSGKRRIPQALVCTNDYMAYGLIDTLFENDFKLPDRMTVIGYEYIGDRFSHVPILSTYYRNRSAIGAKAVSILNHLITDAEIEDIPIDGYMVTGDTCPCGSDINYLKRELHSVRSTNYYRNLNFCNNFEQQLTVCRSLDDYIHVLQQFAYLIRGIKGIYLCLYENWCSRKEKSSLEICSNDEIMAMYRVISPIENSSEPQFFTRGKMFPDNIPGMGDKRFLYLVPMFSAGVEIGHFIFQYTEPDGYDTIIIDWINAAVNALNVLRMKNDINELLACNNLSAFHDSATGIYNKDGLLHELSSAIANADENDVVSAVMLKSRLFTNENRIDEKSISIKLDSEIAECMKMTAVNSSAFCARLQDKQFVYASVGKLPENYHEAIADKLIVLITHSPVYKSTKNIDDIIAVGITSPVSEFSTEELVAALNSEITKKTASLLEDRQTAGFKEFNNVRNAMYHSPEKQWTANEECRNFHISCGHFRAAYKNIFGISFHQDLIQSRIALAKYLLMTSSLSIPAIAAKCGYDDDKYFLRQFRQTTGINPNSYRRRI